MLTEFFIAVGAISALALVLSVIVVIADRTIANYGQVTITVNKEKTFDAQGGRPLLATLKDEEVFIPSACGGRGSCGLCKVKITGGAGDVLPTELPWLTEEEKADKIRLSCQVKCKGDLAVEIPPELLSVKQYATEVTAIADLTADIKQVTLELIEPGAIDFTAGQFIQFEVPEYELTSETVYRAYSIASPPSRHNEIDLQIRLVPQGLCTTYVFEHLRQGDNVTINGPYGEFRLTDTDSEIIFIAGGTGMAPIRSILHDMVENGIDRKASYFFGARSVGDLILRDEMKAFEDELPRFDYIPALSAPAEGEDWDGETGLITEVVDRHLSRTDEVEAYLCGSPGMIDACVKVLTKKGVPEERIYYDKFA